jgi:hypothetical protein
MAKPLSLTFAGETVNFNLEKIDRTKLYGYVESEVTDESGKKCELGTLIGDGRSIVGKGGSAIAYLSQDGYWRKKADLKPVNPEGNPITPVKSSFDAPIELTKKVSIDEYLSHNINSLYQLQADEQNEELISELKSGAIFSFPFSYRGGLESSAGFLLQGSDGHFFMAVGVPTTLDYVGLKAPAAAVPDVEETVTDDDDGLDFSLV